MVKFMEHDTHGRLYFLADDMGAVWLGGWRLLEDAERALEAAEACNWCPEEMGLWAVDVPLDEAGRVEGVTA